MTTADLLKQGIAALNEGRKAEARSLLMQVVQQDERNEMGWLWLSGAVDTHQERRTCLENVLAINPNNGIARRGLESLIAKEGVCSLSAASSQCHGRCTYTMKWQYKVCVVQQRRGLHLSIDYEIGIGGERQPLQEGLNKLGGSGWELVTVQPSSLASGLDRTFRGYYIFKKPAGS